MYLSLYSSNHLDSQLAQSLTLSLSLSLTHSLFLSFSGLGVVLLITTMDQRVLTWIIRRQRVLYIAIPDSTSPRTTDHLRWWMRTLKWYGAALVVLSVAMVVWVGVTRIVDYWHFQYDVIAGWLVGGISAYLSVATIHPPLPTSLASDAADAWEGRREIERRWQGIGHYEWVISMD